jgi:cytochrome c biogenesis protein CcmG, thiol:disulfide interchange protein DsbE
VLRRLLPLIIFLVLAMLLCAGIWLSRNPDREALPSTLIGKHAPSFALPVLDADASSTQARIAHAGDLAGAPYVLNVWGSWCVNCREEHPVVTALAARGIVKVVGYDYHDDPDDARRWLAQFGNPYALIVADSEGRNALDWGIYGAPETYFVDGHGIVRWKHVGGLTDEIVAKELMPLLKPSGAAR